MGRLGIIAARGTLPLELAQAAQSKGERPFIICLEGQSDADFSAFDHALFAPGQLKAVTRALGQSGCDRLLLAGKFTRPSLRQLKLDSAGAALLGRLALKGDDTALRLLSEYFASHQMTILPNTDFLPERLLPRGYHFGRPLNEGEEAALRTGVQLLSDIGHLDVGQAVIAQQDRVLAIDTADGAVFVKMAKSRQDKALDMPVIGIETIESLARAGVQVLAVEASHTMLADTLEAVEAVLGNHRMILTTRLESPALFENNPEEK
jgi:DUF1009 family protein